MTRRATVILCLWALVAVIGLGAGTAGAQSDGVLVVESVDSTGFPIVRAIVSGPAVQGELDEAFTVVEDGEAIEPDVIRVRSDDLNVVVAIDVSGSMAGEPLDRAKAAVAELLPMLPESVPVSVVSFGEDATVQSQFTTDREATQASVDGLIAAGGTALYDGVELSLTQLQRQGGAGALVVLADGADSSSTNTLDDVVDRLGADGVATSFVALETEDFSADSFVAMAGAAAGQVLEVQEATDFVDALRSVGAGLGNVYEVRWRSVSTGDASSARIFLTADESVGVDAVFEHPEVGEFVPDVANDTWTSSGGGLLANSWVLLPASLAVCAGGAYLFLAARNSAGAAERREERQQDRVEKKEERTRRISGMQERLEEMTGHMLEANNRGRSLDDRLDQAGLAIRANEFVVACAAIFLASLVVGVLLFGVPFFFLGGLFPAVGIPAVLKILTARRRKTFVAQLGDTLQLMAGSLTAGYGLGQTLDSVSRETESPTCDEFARVVMETRLGRSLEDALDAMSLRIQAPDFDWVVDAIKIQSSVGGDLAEIISQVGETIRARTRIKRQVDALTAEGKISALVLFCLPFGLGGFIASSNPGYIEPLLSSSTGYVLLGAAATMMTIGGLWLRKLVNPEF